MGCESLRSFFSYLIWETLESADTIRLDDEDQSEKSLERQRD